MQCFLKPKLVAVTILRGFEAIGRSDKDGKEGCWIFYRGL